MKEYLRENPKGVFKAVPYDSSRSGDIEIPEGAEEYYDSKYPSCCFFLKRLDSEKLFSFVDEKEWRLWENFEDEELNIFELKWKREQEVVVSHSLHDRVNHPQHCTSDDCGVGGKTVSDGGSSSYYFTKLPKHIIDEINYTGGIEIKDIARYVYDNNADAFNIIKAQKRIIEDLKGLGKVGADAKYDAKKILFFAEEQYKQIIEGVKIND